jgi:glycosyltransferase involved in cell wall biosynthesis
MIRAVAVVVPVHDEEELLSDCLRSIARAIDAVGDRVRVETMLALDDCTDGSAAIAEAFGFPAVVLHNRLVGAARAAGVRAAAARLDGIDPAEVWTAHTDADSVVPAHWIVHQLDLADAGADVVIGTVRPRFADLTPRQRAAWRATHTPGKANGHVHGANLGVRSSALAAAGGFAPVAAHEDVEVVERLRASGVRVVPSDGAWVRTSGRPVGRAPDGYARYLRDDLVRAAFGG